MTWDSINQWWKKRSCTFFGKYGNFLVFEEKRSFSTSLYTDHALSSTHSARVPLFNVVEPKLYLFMEHPLLCASLSTADWKRPFLVESQKFPYLRTNIPMCLIHHYLMKTLSHSLFTDFFSLVIPRFVASHYLTQFHSSQYSFLSSIPILV